MNATITNVRAAGFKRNPSFNYDLMPQTIIYGLNFTGKTSIAEAIRLAAKGEHPKLGKTNGEIMKLANGDELSTRITTSDGLRVSRNWSRRGQTVTKTEDVPAGWNSDIPLLDPKAYFTMSATARTEYVFKLVPMPAGFDMDYILEKIEDLRDGDDMTTDDEDGIDMIKGWVREALDEDVRAGLIELTGKSGKITAKFTEFNAAQKRGAAASQKAQETVTRAESQAANAIQIIEGEIQDTQREAAALSEKLGAMKNRARTAQRQADRRAEIERELARPARDWDKELDESGTKIRGISARFSDATEEQEREAENAWRTVTAEIAAQIAAKNAAQQAAKTAQRRITELTELGVCKKCTAMLTAPLLAEQEESAKTLSNAEAALATLREEETTLLAAFNRIKENVSKDRMLKASLQEARAESDDIAQAQKEDGAEHAAMRKELAGMEAIKDVPSAAEIAGQEASVTEKEEALKTLRALYRDAVELREASLTATRLIAEYNRDKAIFKVIEKAKGILIKTQAEMIGKVFGAIVEKANEILGSLMPTPLCFFEGEVGRMEAGRFIHNDTFSGAEEALAYVSIAAALSSTAPFRLLVLDEMGVMPGSMQGAVLRRLSECVKRGDLDQVIAIIPRDGTLPERSDWQIIHLQ